MKTSIEPNPYDAAIAFAQSVQGLSLEKRAERLANYVKHLQKGLTTLSDLQHAYQATLDAEQRAFSNPDEIGVGQADDLLRATLRPQRGRVLPSVRVAALAVLYQHGAAMTLRQIEATLTKWEFSKPHDPDRLRSALWPLRRKRQIAVTNGSYRFASSEVRSRFGHHLNEQSNGGTR